MTDTNRPEAVHDVLRDMRQWKGDYSVFADRIERTLSARASAGEGGEWVMVPREPTPEMGMAAGKAVHPATYWQTAYRAMIAAAPQPAQSGASGGGEYEVRKGRDGEWGIFARGYNLRLAVFARGSAVDRDKIAAKLTTPASPATGGKRHVGDSKFESWYADYCRTDWPDGTKQIARDAYAAGMGDATPQPAAAQGGETARRAAFEAWWRSTGSTFELTPDPNWPRGYAISQVQCAWQAWLAAAPQPQEASAQGEIIAIVGERGSVSWRSERILPVGAPLYSTPPAHGDGEAQAWMHEGDASRVISARQKAQAIKDGGASASSVAPYTIALTTRPTPEAQEARDADTRRLDWLEANEFDLVTRREDMGEDEYAIWWFVVDPRKSAKRRMHSISGHPLGSPREAIDAALALPAQGEGDNG